MPTSLKNTAANTTDVDRPQSESVMRSAGIVSLAVLTSRISGLVRELVLARLFGASMAYDAYLLGFRIPNLTRDLFAEGALSSAFVPTFTEYLAKRSKVDAAHLANLVATAIIIVVGTLCALGMIFAPQLVGLLAPGYAAVPGKFELAVEMTRIMFPFLLVVALAAQAMGILNACNKFGVPALSSTFFNIGSVCFGTLLGIALGPTLGISRIEGMAIGVVLGGLLQLMYQVPSLRRLGFRFHPAVDWSEPGLVRILQLMGPAILGNAAVQINVMVTTNFASQICDPVTGCNGPVSWLSYAFRFMQLPLGLFGVAIGSAALPSISRSAAAGNMDEFRQTISHSLGNVFLLTLPSSVGLVVLGESIIGAIYQGGAFQIYDTQQTAIALSCFAIGLSGYSALKVLVPAFYSLGDSRTPMLVSIASIVINLSVATFLMRFFGMGQAGLAVTTSVVALFGFLVQFVMLRNRLGGIHGRALLMHVGRVSLASLAMACVIWFSSTGVRTWLGVSHLARVADVAVSVPLGAAVYYFAAKALGLSGIDMVLKSFTGPIQRYMPRWR
ncbi:MAG: murein biosynthesis integral membrane protein MurJ [Acidobacteriota bacterium]